jgi:hypothetical protein
MPPEERNLASLWDMRQAAREILVERIWIVATERVPELLPLLEPLIPSPPKTDV